MTYGIYGDEQEDFSSYTRQNVEVSLENYSRKLQDSKRIWASQSACKDTPSAVFPSSKEDEITAVSEICSLCPVQAQCLKLAIVNQEEYGVWGGYTSTELKKIYKDIHVEFGDIWQAFTHERAYFFDLCVDVYLGKSLPQPLAASS